MRRREELWEEGKQMEDGWKANGEGKGMAKGDGENGVRRGREGSGTPIAPLAQGPAFANFVVALQVLLRL